MKRTIIAMLSAVLMFSAVGANAAVEKTERLGGFNAVVTYTPTSKSPLGGRSLLIVLHGCAQSYTAFKGAKLGDAADANGMVVAVPDAMSKAGMACWDYWGMPPGRNLNDYGRLIKLAQEMTANSALEIDPNQVYIAGLSSGGAFAMETACLAPDIFAGMGLVGAPSAGTGMGGAIGPKEGTVASTKESCLATAGSYKSHFDTQVTVSAAGTSDGTVNQGYAEQNARAMAEIYGHSHPSVSLPVDRAVAIINTEKSVVQMALTGEGHAWPGGPGASGSFIGGASINFATFLGNYFNENNRRAADPVGAPVVNVTATAAGVDILVTGNAVAGESGRTIASATIELKNTKNDAVTGPFPLSLSGSQFSYNGFTNLNNATYEVIVKATDNKGTVGTGTQSVQITAGADTSCPSVSGLRDSFDPSLVTVGGWGIFSTYTTTGDAKLLDNATQQYTIYIGNNKEGYLVDPEDCVPVVEEFTVSANAGTGGAVNPKTQKIVKGKSATVTVTPNSGYSIKQVTGCGGSLSGNTYSIPSVTSNCSVQATFSKDAVEYTVTATAGVGGNVSPATQKVASGQSASVSVSANSGYEISTVTGCNGSLSGNNYFISSVTDNCSVAANFVKVNTDHTVTASSNAGGSVSPATQTVKNGMAATINLTTANGYSIESVTGCGGSRSGSTYLITSVTESCHVTAKFTKNAVEEYTVTASHGEGGTISPSGSIKVVAGQTVSFTVKADSGYTINNVLGCDGRLNGNTYTTAAVNSSCNVVASFTKNAPIKYTVTAKAGIGGSVSPETQDILAGTAATVRLTADNGYSIKEAIGCGGTLSGSTYVIDRVTSNCTVQASFTKNAPTTYQVTASAGEGGDITPRSRQVIAGQTASFTVTTNSGYFIAGVEGCGGSLNGNTYTTSAVYSNCNVVASFSENAPTTYQVTASAGEGGAITPPSRQVIAGQTASFTVTANGDYDIDSVVGCGGSLNGNTYTTAAINSTCTVVASFKAKSEEPVDPEDPVGGGSTTPLMVIFGLALVAIRRRQIAS